MCLGLIGPRKKRKESDKEMKTKMAVAFAALMIALMVAGIGYAMWDKRIYLYGTVETGEVDAEWSAIWCDDTGIDPGYDKDVASCVCEIDSVDPQMAHVTIYNGYPSYSVTIWYEIDNWGTIPVKIQDIILTNPNPEVTVTVTDIYIGQQIEPYGDYVTGDLEIHIEQIADELSTYYFDLEVYLVQWNEFT
jgi:hypothetical protein